MSYWISFQSEIGLHFTVKNVAAVAAPVNANVKGDLDLEAMAAPAVNSGGANVVQSAVGTGSTRGVSSSPEFPKCTYVVKRAGVHKQRTLKLDCAPLRIDKGRNTELLLVPGAVSNIKTVRTKQWHRGWYPGLVWVYEHMSLVL